MKRFYIIGLVIIVLIIVIVFSFATVSKNKMNLDSVFSGPTSSNTSNLAINSLNGMVTTATPSKYQGNYLDWEEVIPEAKILIDNYDVIKSELNTVLQDYDNIPEFDKIDDHQGNLANSDHKKWKTFIFKFYDDYNDVNCKKCPETAKLLKKLPLDLAMFSIMEKGKVLIPHRGPWRGLLRLHLGLEIPEGATITVDGQDYQWKEKELVLFDDTYIHSVKNPNGRRVVLFMDIKRNHIPYIFHRISNLAGKQYFNKVNKKIESSSSKNL